MCKFTKLSLPLLALFITVSCSTGAGKGHNHASHISSTHQLPLKKAGVFVFRSPNDDSINKTTTNIYVDGSYLSSLKKGEYRYSDLCPGQHYIDFAYANHDPAYLTKLDRNQVFQLQTGEVFYVEVIGDGVGGVKMRAVSQGSVENMLPSLHLQQRTISRVMSDRDC